MIEKDYNNIEDLIDLKIDIPVWKNIVYSSDSGSSAERVLAKINNHVYFRIRTLIVNTIKGRIKYEIAHGSFK